MTSRATRLSLLLLASFSQVSLAADAGFYVGASIGLTRADAEPGPGVLIATPQFFLRVPPESIAIEDGEEAWGGLLEYRLNRHLAIELAYHEFGDIEATETFFRPEVPGFFPSVTITRNFTQTVTGPSLSLLGIVSVGWHFDLFARGGMFFAEQETEYSPPRQSLDHTTDEEVWIAGVGVDWSLAQRWSLRLEYQLTDDIKRDDKIDVNDTPGMTSLENFTLGVSYRF